ncbi:MAG: HDOD domain-containing protein [Phycisphaerales bacterium]
MKPRSLLTARELDATRASIARRMERMAIETQPEIAAAVLDLALDRSAGLAQFADVIGSDAALSGRVLQLSNSSFFRRGDEVADLERACVVLGAERLRGVAMGFSLDRSDPASPERRLARRVWRESILRACVARALAERTWARLGPMAFAAGLMLDVGQPLLARLLGAPALEILLGGLPPAAMFEAESRSLPFTHVDVASVVCGRWKLPAALAGAVAHHHDAASGNAPETDAERLRAIMHIAGVLEIDHKAGGVRQCDLVASVAERTLGLSGASLWQGVREGEKAFGRVRHSLQGASAAASDPAALAERIKGQIDRAVDQMLGDVLRRDEPGGARSIRVGGSLVEIDQYADGRWGLCLLDSMGERIARHVIVPGETVACVLESLALEPREGDQIEALSRVLRMVA